VAAQRHSFRVRVGVSLVALIAVGGCSGGSKTSNNSDGACALIAKLDDTAAKVARADVSDPAAFKKTLDKAVAQYLGTLRALRPRVSADARRSVDRIVADVQQLRFDDARGDRTELDDYAEQECGRRTVTTSSTAP
jgi:hypothetical protein